MNDINPASIDVFVYHSASVNCSGFRSKGFKSSSNRISHYAEVAYIDDDGDDDDKITPKKGVIEIHSFVRFSLSMAACSSSSSSPVVKLTIGRFIKPRPRDPVFDDPDIGFMYNSYDIFGRFSNEIPFREKENEFDSGTLPINVRDSFWMTGSMFRHSDWEELNKGMGTFSFPMTALLRNVAPVKSCSLRRRHITNNRYVCYRYTRYIPYKFSSNVMV